MTDHDSRLDGYRHRRDHFFAEHPHSPLTEDQREHFHGLDYFPERDDLAFNLSLDESGTGVGEQVDLPTTDGKTKAFIRAGSVHFPVDGTEVSLSVFRDVDRGGLFIPFLDSSTGTETYEFGRYLEPKGRPDDTLDIDFNYAYNPFCAYGEGWSCPIPPDENRLPVPIGAGERTFREREVSGRETPESTD